MSPPKPPPAAGLPSRRGPGLRVRLTASTLALALIAGVLGAYALRQRQVSPPCRFGITAPYGVAGYDLAGLGVGAYLDWDMRADPPRPGGVEYIQVVRLGDAVFAEQLARLPAVAAAQPGAHWLVGNEPDNAYTFDGHAQDNLAPEVYAERYHAVHAALRAADPRALVGLGGITQPTPARLEYLDRVLAAYRERFGRPPPADFWFVHAFVLNEVPGEWGAGLPPDNAARPYQALPEAFPPDEADSLERFLHRIQAMRAWMLRNGQSGLPLWVTEYGVLMPSDAGAGFFSIPLARTGDFLRGSVAYLQSAADPALGLPADGDRLVQRWFWWTLSYDPRLSGGGLYDQSQRPPAQTELYSAFAALSNCR
jgi:hypothetical protein